MIANDRTTRNTLIAAEAELGAVEATINLAMIQEACMGPSTRASLHTAAVRAALTAETVRALLVTAPTRRKPTHP